MRNIPSFASFVALLTRDFLPTSKHELSSGSLHNRVEFFLRLLREAILPGFVTVCPMSFPPQFPRCRSPIPARCCMFLLCSFRHPLTPTFHTLPPIGFPQENKHVLPHPVVDSRSVEGSLTIVVHSKLIFICLSNSLALPYHLHTFLAPPYLLHHSPQRPKNNENELLCEGRRPHQLTPAQRRNQPRLAPHWANQERGRGSFWRPSVGGRHLVSS